MTLSLLSLFYIYILSILIIRSKQDVKIDKAVKIAVNHLTGLELSSNSFIVEDRVFIDVSRATRTDELIRFMKKEKIDFDSIELIILTHSHFDHCGIKRIKELCKNAKLMVHKKEEKYLKSGTFRMNDIWILTPIIQIFVDLFSYFFKYFTYEGIEPDIVIVDSVSTLEDYGFDIPGFTIYHTPYHTIGSISITYKNNTIFTGDAFFGALNQGHSFLKEKRIVMMGHGTPIPMESFLSSLYYLSLFFYLMFGIFIIQLVYSYLYGSKKVVQKIPKERINFSDQEIVEKKNQ